VRVLERGGIERRCEKLLLVHDCQIISSNLITEAQLEEKSRQLFVFYRGDALTQEEECCLYLQFRLDGKVAERLEDHGQVEHLHQAVGHHSVVGLVLNHHIVHVLNELENFNAVFDQPSEQGIVWICLHKTVDF